MQVLMRFTMVEIHISMIVMLIDKKLLMWYFLYINKADVKGNDLIAK